MPRRRGHGEGTVRQRPGGRWEGRYYDATGERRSVYAATQRECLKALREAQRQDEEGRRVLTKADTVGRYLTESWLENHIRPNTEPGTYRNRLGQVQTHYAPALGHLRLDQVTPQHIEAFVAGLRKKGLAESTVWNLRNGLTAAFNRAVEMDLIARNPCKAVTVPRPGSGVQVLLSPPEIKGFVHALRGQRYEGVFLLCLLCGLRVGEALGLTWDNVDLENMEARIVRQMQREVGAGLVLKELKTGRHGTRSVPLPRQIIPVLLARKDQERVDYQASPRWHEEWDKAGLVFRNTVGNPVQDNNLRTVFYRWLEKSGLDHMRIHDLRHGYATGMFEQGYSPRMIQELLGHTDVSVTLNIYTHISKGAKRVAAEGWEKLLGDDDDARADASGDGRGGTTER